ncbi:hypothetical protein [Streptomyces sp. P5_D11]
MNPPAHPTAPASSEDCDWTPVLKVGLGRACDSCRPSGASRGPDPRRWLEGIPRPDTGRLALACALVGYEEHTATIERAAALTMRARLRAQQLFPYGLGPVLGDLMLPADGGGDMLRALSDVAESLFARRGLPRTYPVCPWGSTVPHGCGRDPFGRLQHDHCHAPSGPVPAWRAKSWAVWTWRTACALDRLPPHLIQHRHPRPVDMAAPGRIEAGMIGPIVLLIGKDGPAQRARASSDALTALILALKPAHVDDRAALFGLNDHLKPPRGGPFVWGWRGYAPAHCSPRPSRPATPASTKAPTTSSSSTSPATSPRTAGKSASPRACWRRDGTSRCAPTMNSAPGCAPPSVPRPPRTP